MTNIDRWRLYCRDIFSPDHFVDWGWYSLVSAVLQRRVFFDNEENPLFAAQYIVLIGPPGVGKGLVLDKVSEFIKHFRQYTAPMSNMMSAVNSTHGGARVGDRYMFPLAADSTTFESLLVEVVEAAETYKGIDGKERMQSSLYFLLDEYTSIFKQHADELITFLQTAWNAKDYTRKTKHQGVNSLKNPCINILGGTTPSDFSKLLRREVIGSGIMGRTILVFGQKNRGRGIKIPAPDEEQLKAKAELLEHIKLLKSVVQCVKYSAEAEEFLTEWYSDEHRVRVNKNQLLDEYYVRKLTHVHKICMALHFSDPGFEKPMSRTTVARAIDILNKVEPQMHMALMAGGRNELSPITAKILEWMTRYPAGVSESELLCQFGNSVTHFELQEILRTAQATGELIYNSVQRLYNRTEKS